MKFQEESFYTMPENFTWSAQAILMHTQMSFIQGASFTQDSLVFVSVRICHEMV